MKSAWNDIGENGFFILRMFIASLCGAAIGIERSRRQKDAGIRTHIIVALGAALMMLVSKYGFFDVVVYDGINLDASRIAANVVTGVSFLGAGVIFVKDISIKGLTTAAGIWATSAVGMAIGAGQYTIGIAATVMMIIFQLFLHRFLSGLENTVNEFRVVLKDVPGAFFNFRSELDEKKIVFENCKMKRNLDDGTLLLDITIRKSRSISMKEVIAAASEDPNVISIDI